MEEPLSWIVRVRLRQAVRVLLGSDYLPMRPRSNGTLTSVAFVTFKAFDQCGALLCGTPARSRRPKLLERCRCITWDNNGTRIVIEDASPLYRVCSANVSSALTSNTNCLPHADFAPAHIRVILNSTALSKISLKVLSTSTMCSRPSYSRRTHRRRSATIRQS